MKTPGKIVVLYCIYISCFFFSFQILGGTEIQLVDKLKFPTESGLSSCPWDFCVTDDGLFMIPDPHAGDTKIFKFDTDVGYLKLVDILGHKGISETDFIEPTYCFTDNLRYGVFDFSTRKIVLYRRINNISSKNRVVRSKKAFEFEKSIYCPRAGNDFEISGNYVYISGFHPDPANNPYDLYSIDISTQNKYQSVLDYTSITYQIRIGKFR